MNFSGAHGYMFHHFNGEGHPEVLGSITSKDLYSIIEHAGPDRFLSAQEWLVRSNNGTLREQDLCLTFDDALLCQFDIARPVLKEFDLTAFWFVYSSVFEGNAEMLEVYRYFSCTYFNHINQFYEAFAEEAETCFPETFRLGMEGFTPESYLISFPFYSLEDKKYRFLRDDILGTEKYHKIMQALLRKFDFNLEKVKSLLWMNNKHLKALDNDGHIIGLHSYSHPTRLNQLPRRQQQEEYEKNFSHLTEILGKKPRTMSHPCNSYNDETLEILSSMGIQLGFCSNMSDLVSRSKLEYRRQDHAILLKELKQ